MQCAQRLCHGCRQQHGNNGQSSPLRQNASLGPWPLQLASLLHVSVEGCERELSTSWVCQGHWQLL